MADKVNSVVELIVIPYDIYATLSPEEKVEADKILDEEQW